ncbi:DNA gyrase inhibitor YacG [bacterium AH-315-J04]|nr:DNA gyrase inhibitor YacG [bacterium AH-315-J04]
MPTFDCPTCQKLITVAKREDAPYRPFCCERCKQVDLGKWLDGTYCISEPLIADELPEEV